MMKTVGLVLLVCAGACHVNSDAAPPGNGTSMNLTWTVKHLDGRLRAEYRITNNTAAPILVLDRFVVFADGGYRLAPDEVITMGGDAAGTARLVKGFVMPEADVRKIILPVSRPLAPGASLDGVADAALPLAFHHPNDPQGQILKGPFDKVVLEVGYLAGDAAVEPFKLGDGTTVTVPTMAAVTRQAFLRGVVLRLP